MEKIKQIDVGKFYFIHDGSKTGHPGFIIWKDDEKNLYLAIKFGTSPNENNILYKRPIGEKAKHSFYYKRLLLGKRKDFDKRILKDMKLNKKEIKELINKFDFANPVFSKNLNRRDKKYYKWITKQKGNKKSPLSGAIV